jgi:hypothetical protein
MQWWLSHLWAKCLIMILVCWCYPCWRSFWVFLTWSWHASRCWWRSHAWNSRFYCFCSHRLESRSLCSWIGPWISTWSCSWVSSWSGSWSCSRTRPIIRRVNLVNSILFYRTFHWLKNIWSIFLLIIHLNWNAIVNNFTIALIILRKAHTLLVLNLRSEQSLLWVFLHYSLFKQVLKLGMNALDLDWINHIWLPLNKSFDSVELLHNQKVSILLAHINILQIWIKKLIINLLKAPLVWS